MPLLKQERLVESANILSLKCWQSCKPHARVPVPSEPVGLLWPLSVARTVVPDKQEIRGRSYVSSKGSVNG